MAKPMLEVKALNVSVQGRTVLRDVNFLVNTGETVVLFGPNGSGKTSLLQTIIGYPDYRIDSGEISFKGWDITGLTIDARARLGIGIAFQRPPAVRGVKVSDLLGQCMIKRGEVGGEVIAEYSGMLNFSEFLSRELNLGFSGGEMKRSELLQLMVQKPNFVMLDEPDSGVDLVSINIIAAAINRLLEKDIEIKDRKRSGMIITHAGHILDYVSADRAYVMIKGVIYCSGRPKDVLNDIRDKGYEGCIVCEK